MLIPQLLKSSSFKYKNYRAKRMLTLDLLTAVWLKNVRSKK